MKTKIIIVCILVWFNSSAQQKIYLMEGGSMDTGKVTVQFAVAPLFIPYQTKDTGYIGLKFNEIDFKVVEEGLALANNNISTSEWYGRIVAVGNQKNFIFPNIPVNYWDYQMFKNGVKIIPEVDYFKTGNSIYIPSARNNYTIEYYRLR